MEAELLEFAYLFQIKFRTLTFNRSIHSFFITSFDFIDSIFIFPLLGHLIFLTVMCISFSLLVRLFLRFGIALDFSDGAHIVDLIKVKLFRSSPTFHTLLYTCAAAFDFLPVII